jgi:hypothetical protein
MSQCLFVRSVGAGGGSIAKVPALTRALRVGPESAGAEPGPAAYGRGGAQPTVTDANVPDSTVDEAATPKLRETMAAGRGTVAIFDFGPPVEELRRRCLDETGLPTPVSPRFTRVVHPPG